MALGTFLRGSAVSSARAAEFSHPTNMKIASGNPSDSRGRPQYLQLKITLV